MLIQCQILFTSLHANNYFSVIELLTKKKSIMGFTVNTYYAHLFVSHMYNFIPVSNNRVCYSRVKWNPLLLSFLLSATWHGFYPSYYFGFVYLGLTINASRKVREFPSSSLSLYL